MSSSSWSEMVFDVGVARAGGHRPVPAGRVPHDVRDGFSVVAAVTRQEPGVVAAQEPVEAPQDGELEQPSDRHLSKKQHAIF